MFAKRLKQLRKETGMTQVQLAEKMGVSKGTVAMWEIGKREPNFETLDTLSSIFDRRIDYILGRSDDASSVEVAEEDLDQNGRWEVEGLFYLAIMQYLQLDYYGKNAVEAIIGAEIARCREQDSLFPESDFKLNIRIKAKTNVEEQNAEHK